MTVNTIGFFENCISMPHQLGSYKYKNDDESRNKVYPNDSNIHIRDYDAVSHAELLNMYRI